MYSVLRVASYNERGIAKSNAVKKGKARVEVADDDDDDAMRTKQLKRICEEETEVREYKIQVRTYTQYMYTVHTGSMLHCADIFFFSFS